MCREEVQVKMEAGIRVVFCKPRKLKSRQQHRMLGEKHGMEPPSVP